MEMSKSAATSLRIGASVRMPAWLAKRARKSTTDGDPRLRAADLSSRRDEIAMDGKKLTPEQSIERALSAVEPTVHQRCGKPNVGRSGDCAIPTCTRALARLSSRKVVVRPTRDGA